MLAHMSDCTKAAGGSVQCSSCSRPLGRLIKRPPATVTHPAMIPAAGGDNSWLPDLPFMSRTDDRGSGSATPTSSALKRGSAVCHKKSKTAERLDAIRAKEEDQLPKSLPTRESSGR